jgi:hypothetical protein
MIMDCEKYREQLLSLFTGSLDDPDRRELEDHLAGCPDCQIEYRITRKVWDLMGETPDPIPSDSLRAGFQTILRNYREESKAVQGAGRSFTQRIRELWRLQPRIPFAFLFLFLVLGLATGWMLNRPGKSENSDSRQINSLSSEVLEMKQMMMLSLLENPSASERIRAVGYSDEIGDVNKKVIDALFTTLNGDPNINVRLITLEALVRFSKDPKVREGLVKSISQQDSPLLQSALADAMVKLQEKRSVNSLQSLLHRKDLNALVKIKIEQSIQKLI